MLTPINEARFMSPFADAIRARRSDWHRPGILAALWTAIDNGHDPFTVAMAMLRRAANPANRTPRLQPADFDDTPRRTCALRGCYPHGLCAGCAVERGVVHDVATCEVPPSFVVVRTEESA